VVLAVAHEVYKKLNLDDIKKENAVVYDVKAVLDKGSIDGRL
jgi:UDP-N-acetyl-D-galactosamine dehydrogenase